MIFLIILLVLALFGRLACFYICPLGIAQELIYKIPGFKKFKKLPYEEQLRKIKYVILVLLIILIPTVIIPFHDKLDTFLLVFKIVGFSLVFILSLFILRPFCKFFCPIGVFLGIFNKLPWNKHKVKENCVKCGYCAKQCRMNLNPTTDINSIECIRCGKCSKSCPKKSITKKM